MPFLKKYFIILIVFTCADIFGQMIPNAVSRNTYLSNDILGPVDDYYIKHPDFTFHSSFKPYNYVAVNKLNDLDIPYKHMKVHNYFLSKAVCDTPKFKNVLRLQILPQVNIEQGYDVLRAKMTNETSGGLRINMDVNKKLSLSAQYIGGYITMPNFMDTVTKEYGVVPGLGMAYKTPNYDSSAKGPGRYSFNNFSGYLSYSPKNFINFQLGKDKFFIGDGYRSLLLSDVATNYPYFKTTLNLWHFQYSAWYSWLYDISASNGIKKNFQNKFGTFHYLSWNACKTFNISFFENVIWQGTDSSRTRGFDANYLNPVIFFRPIEYSLGSSDNAMIGANTSWTIAKHVKLYGQVVLDEFYLKEIRAHKGWWGNKQGGQFGVKYVDAFGVKKLTLQTEVNIVRPYTYSHGSTLQSYSQYGQALAHPFGANFKELIGIASYRHFRYRLDGKLIYAEIGRDTFNVATSNVGQNIFLSYTTRPYDYGHYVGQGIKTTFLQAELRYTYYLIADWNLRLEAGFIQRIYKRADGFDRETPFVYVGIRTNLYNNYRDY